MTSSQGTPEFMSRHLFGADEHYLHSPKDDLESCFWVSMWSVLFNEDNMGGQFTKEKRMREQLADNEKASAIDTLTGLTYDQERSDIMRLFRLVLLDWWKGVRDCIETWDEEVLRNKPKNADGEYYLPHFHRFALKGVLDVLQVLARHWDGDISLRSWTAPAPST